jgi:hypothetical protein
MIQISGFLFLVFGSSGSGFLYHATIIATPGKDAFSGQYAALLPFYGI